MNSTAPSHSSSGTIPCENTVPVYVLEGIKIGFACIAAISLTAIKTIKSVDDQAHTLARNKIIIGLTATAHAAYFATMFASLIEQTVINPLDADFTAFWNQLQLGGACLQTIQIATSSYHSYNKQVAKRNKPVAAVDPALPEASGSGDTWSARLGKVAQDSVLQGSLVGQVALSIITMETLYHKKCS